MVVHTIRPDFTITLGHTIYVGGEEVDLNNEEYELNKHKLEGVESSVIPIDFGSGQNQDGDCCFPAPYISRIFPAKIVINSTQNIILKGSFFTPDTTVNLTGATVTNIVFVSSNEITFDVTAGSEVGLQNLTINNGQDTSFENALKLVDLASFVIDFRAGATQFTNAAIETRSNMSWTRTPQGLIATGSSGWGRWIRFAGDNDAWIQARNQENPPSLNLIYQPNYGMIGIGSREANADASSQYTQQELVQFYNSPTVIYGWYGNNGTPGRNANFQDSGNINDNYVYRLQIDGLGSPGAEYKLYELPGAEDINQLSGNALRDFYAESSNITDWLGGTLVKQGTIAENMTADAAEVMPVILSHNLAFRILGFYYL